MSWQTGLILLAWCAQKEGRKLFGPSVFTGLGFAWTLLIGWVLKKNLCVVCFPPRYSVARPPHQLHACPGRLVGDVHAPDQVQDAKEWL